MKSMKVMLLLSMTVLTYGCSSGSNGDDDSGENASISGKITYDNVPHSPSTHGLNYNATTQDPVRGVTVQLLQGGTVVDTATTDNSGNYSLAGKIGTNYILRVRAELKQTGTQAWDIEVVDNTSGNALYVLDSASFQADSTTFTRNLNAASGWGGNSYTSTRAAAPFHILDRVYDIIDKLRVVDANLQLDPLVINWSPNNIPQSGNLNTGQIGTSFYSAGKIYLLGAEDTDTDEYDGHVIIHEWGHYFEDNNARSDSIGGSHGGIDRLDMRVAFGEGFGNAWSAMITDDPIYRDSLNSGQSQGFSINIVAYDDAGGSSTVNITHNFTAGTYVADVSAYRADACFSAALIQN